MEKRAKIIRCKSYTEYMQGIANLRAANFTKTLDGINIEHWEGEAFRFVVIKDWID